ncbi:cytochrome-c peroxidase [Haliangium sp.]|uniref:cytochrome-c peroxidase n=1 Tax=Haliangium sp. TaxID=2663208 RepID=UPI003D0B27B7
MLHRNSVTLFAKTPLLALVGLSLALGACAKDEPEEAPPMAGAKPMSAAKTVTADTVAAGPDAAALLQMATGVFAGPLPERSDAAQPATEAQIALGRMLYHDPRLSKGQDISCNSCHSLSDYGIDVRAPEGQRQVSVGHMGQKGARNSPTVYNAGFHFRQFWDGRAANLAEQAKGPVLNPVEMAMPNEDAVVALLKTIPGYVEAFSTAYPDAKQPVTYDNMATAIAGFEAGLTTPSRFDDFLAGQTDALSPQELRGLEKFLKVGCTTCHMGTALGGTLYQKLGLAKPYATEDTGRHAETGTEADKFMFKVPSLRNIAETGPYLHDGSVASLEEVVKLMVEYQLVGGEISDAEVADVVAFLRSLTGKIPSEYIAAPELPESSAKTPKPDKG